MPIRSIRLRRSSFHSTATSHSARLTITVGQGSYSNFGTTFASNYTGTPTVVLKDKTVNFPNWSTVTKQFPAPFDFAPPLDKLYVYTGTSELIVEFKSDAPANYSFGSVDGANWRTNGDVYGGSRQVSNGCVVGTNTSAMRTTFYFISKNGGASSEIYMATYYAPATVPAFFLLGLTNPNLKIPGLCATLNANPDFVFLIGTTDSSGTARNTLQMGPYSGKLAGAMLYGQTLAPDTSRPKLPLALGHAVQVQLPPNTMGPVTTKHLFATPSHRDRGTRREQWWPRHAVHELMASTCSRSHRISRALCSCL